MNLVPEQGTLFLPFAEVQPNGARGLRAGVVLEGNRPRPWTAALVAFLEQIPGFEVRVFHLTGRESRESPKSAWLTDRLYSMSRSRFDPFGDIAPASAEAAISESADAILAAGCDVVIWLADRQDPGLGLSSLAKHGVFTVRFGDRNRAIPFWDEVANGSATSTATIFWHDQSFAQGRAVRQAETATSQGLFLTMNAEQPLAAIIRMLAALCLEIQRGSARFQERVRSLPAKHLDNSNPHGYPTNFDAAGFVGKKLARSAYRRWAARGKQSQWFIAMRANRGGSISDPARLDLTGFKELPLPSGVKAMADPFLYESGGAIYLLFEEVAEGQTRGRLGCMEVLQDGSCGEMRIILDRPYHLSYPCVVPNQGELFLLPETAEARRVEILRFSRFPWDLESVSAPVEGAALVDTTPVHIDGRWYFFTTTAEPFMETLLFSASKLEGPWRLHPSNPVSSSVRSCRSAGQLFWRNGRLFRPTQDCSVRYGYAITVNEVIKLTPHEFEERHACYVPPSWLPDLLGTHTWNESAAFQVLDGIRYTR